LAAATWNSAAWSLWITGCTDRLMGGEKPHDGKTGSPESARYCLGRPPMFTAAGATTRRCGIRAHISSGQEAAFADLA
jgi:hypothetical protein